MRAYIYLTASCASIVQVLHLHDLDLTEGSKC